MISFQSRRPIQARELRVLSTSSPGSQAVHRNGCSRDMTSAEDEVLRRFAALRGVPTASPIATGHVDERARLAKAEDDELDAIADGRSLPDHSVFHDAGPDEDAELAKRVAQLRGSPQPRPVEDGDMPDDEVSCFCPSLD